MSGPVPELSVHYLLSCTRSKTRISDSWSASSGTWAQSYIPHPGPLVFLVAQLPFPSCPNPSKAISSTQPSLTPRVSSPPPELERLSAPQQLQTHSGPYLREKKKEVFLIFLPYLFPASLSVPSCPLHFVLGTSHSGLLFITGNSPSLPPYPGLPSSEGRTCEWLNLVSPGGN